MSGCSTSDIQQQNLILNAFVEKSDTDFTKIGYVLEQNRTALKVNFYLFCIYFVLVLIYAYFLISNGKQMTIYMRLGLLSIFVIYPFIITKTEVFLWQIFKYLYDTMVGNVYITPDY